METPIQVLIKEINYESQNACEIYSHLQDKSLSQKNRKITNDSYVLSIRRISELVHAIEKLNQI